MEKIYATIVTGFLGAGKTSLIEQLIKRASIEAPNNRFALMINEFGACGIDKEILQACGLNSCARGEIIELANGCICCTVADDFLPAMEKILRRKPQPTHIVIETSGLALPKPLVKAFAWPDIENRVTVDGVIALADGVALAAGGVVGDEKALQAQREADQALDHESPIEELFEEQIACADLVVLTKCDLLSSAERARAKARLQSWLRAGVGIVESSLEKPVPNSLLLGLQAGAEHDLASRHSHHDEGDEHEHDDFRTITMRFGEVESHALFHQRLQQAIAEYSLLRVKGFLAHSGKPMRECVQAVGTRVVKRFDRPFASDEARTSVLVVITQNNKESEEGLFESKLRAKLALD